jgi:hypothetical protein
MNGSRGWAARARGSNRSRVKRPKRKDGSTQSGRHDCDERNRNRDKKHVFNQGLARFGVPLSHPFYFQVESG